MTPPPKKTSRPATSAAKRGAAKKPAPKRKKTRRKSSGWSLTALAAAVAVGVALTLSTLWIVNRLDGPPEPRSYTAAPGGGQKRPALSEKSSGKREGKPAPASPDDRRPAAGAKSGAGGDRNDRTIAEQGRNGQRAASEGTVSGPAARAPAIPPGPDAGSSSE